MSDELAKRNEENKEIKNNLKELTAKHENYRADARTVIERHEQDILTATQMYINLIAKQVNEIGRLKNIILKN